MQVSNPEEFLTLKKKKGDGSGVINREHVYSRPYPASR